MLKVINGFIASNTVEDFGDCARAHGIVELHGAGKLSPMLYRNSIHYFVNMGGLCVRHPYDEMYSNPWNFTRDQLIPLTAGLWRRNSHVSRMQLRAIFWGHAKRLFFCQNFQRDYPGTWKYPWPHKMTGGDPVDEGKWKMFDFADPLLPQHICHLILCARIYWLYFLLPIGWAFLLLDIIFNSEKLDREQNQLQSMVMVYGKPFVALYKKFNKMWSVQTYFYWVKERDCEEISNLIVDSLRNIK